MSLDLIFLILKLVLCIKDTRVQSNNSSLISLITSGDILTQCEYLNVRSFDFLWSSPFQGRIMMIYRDIRFTQDHVFRV